METQNQGTEQVHPDSEAPKTGLRTTELCGRYISLWDNQVDTLHTSWTFVANLEAIYFIETGNSKSPHLLWNTAPLPKAMLTHEILLHCKEWLTKSWDLSFFFKFSSLDNEDATF